MEPLGKKLIIFLVIVICLVQILLTIPAFRTGFCVVEQLEGRPVGKPF